jgi:hypothetical protein
MFRAGGTPTRREFIQRRELDAGTVNIGEQLAVGGTRFETGPLVGAAAEDDDVLDLVVYRIVVGADLDVLRDQDRRLDPEGPAGRRRAETSE